MTIRPLFATPVYEASLTTDRSFENFNAEILQACESLAEEDVCRSDGNEIVDGLDGGGVVDSRGELDRHQERRTVGARLRAAHGGDPADADATVETTESVETVESEVEA